jgi:hypothetical protein
MKKAITAMITLALVVTLAGCGSSPAKSTDAPAPMETPAPTTEQSGTTNSATTTTPKTSPTEKPNPVYSYEDFNSIDETLAAGEYHETVIIGDWAALTVKSKGYSYTTVVTVQKVESSLRTLQFNGSERDGAGDGKTVYGGAVFCQLVYNYGIVEAKAIGSTSVKAGGSRTIETENYTVEIGSAKLT